MISDGPLHYHTKELRADKIVNCYPEKLPVLRQSGTRSFFSLKTDDIEGAQPHSKDFRTNRSVDPLDPDYKLPVVVEKPPTPPRFLRDNMDISNIEGTRPKPLYTKTIRNTNLDVSDIAEQKTEAKEIRPRTIDYMVLTSDININDPKPYQYRQPDFNPSNPIYQWTHAEKPASVGSTLVNEKLQNRNVSRHGDLSLKTDDIMQEDRVKWEKMYGSMRKAAKNTQTCLDIEGAKAMYTFNRYNDKCKKYYGKELHDPAIRDKDYAQLCGSVSGKELPFIYSPDFIGMRLANSYSGDSRGWYGIKKSMGDETFDNPMAKVEPTAYVPAHQEAPSLETGYEIPHNNSNYNAYARANPHSVPEFKQCPDEHVYKKKIELYEDDSGVPHAGEVIGVEKYRTATELCETLPGPSRDTLLENAKPTVGRKEASNIGHWRKIIDRRVDASNTYDREYYRKFNAARGTGSMTLRDFSGGQKNAASVPVPNMGGSVSGNSLRGDSRAKVAQDTPEQQDRRQYEVQMVRDLPVY